MGEKAGAGYLGDLEEEPLLVRLFFFLFSEKEDRPPAGSEKWDGGLRKVVK